MKEIYLTRQQIQKLKQYHIGNETVSNEAKFYRVPHHPKYLYKLYKHGNEQYLERKEQKVRLLNAYKNEIDIPNLVLPNKIIYINNEFGGIRIDRIKGKNLSVILYGDKIPLSYKIKLLKQLGTLLSEIKKRNPTLNLAFGDVHPDNFLVKDDNVYGIDTDGMKILNSPGRISYFLTSGLIFSTNKYTLAKDGLPEATNDTDIFCFIMIIFQLLTGYRSIFRIPLDTYKQYLDYLDTLGFNTKLLEAFSSIYDLYNPNIDPTPYLDYLFVNEKTSYQEFNRHF